MEAVTIEDLKLLNKLRDDEMKNFEINVEPFKTIQRPPEAYKNDSEPRGAIFIANYREVKDHKTRYVSEIDVANVTNLFNQMGYKLVVEVLQDKSKDETIDALQSFSKHKIHDKGDSMVLVVMSHGIFDNTFLTSDGQTVENKEIYSIFNDENCPALKGKTKFVIFKHCRGKFNPLRTLSSCPDSRSSQKNRCRPKDRKGMSDTFLLWSTWPGELCFNNNTYGSVYIHHVCKVFMKNACQSRFYVLMNELEESLSKYQRCNYIEIKIKKPFYFNPKSIDCNDVQGKNRSGCKNQTETVGGESKLNKLLPKENRIAGSSSLTKLNPSVKHFVLLINNLAGCASDMAQLRDLFTSLGYTVIGPVLNVTYEKLKDVLKEFKKRDHGESAFIVLYGDGFDDYIVTSDHYAIHLNDLQREFNNTNCPKLCNIPKVFITNLCYFEGDVKYESTYQIISHTGHHKEIDLDSEDWVIDGNYEKPNECIQQSSAISHMFSINVEMEGSRCEKGSLLTKAIYKTLMQNNSPKPVVEIMRSVSNELDELQEREHEREEEHVREEYYCQLQTIRFPLDFHIDPIKDTDNLTMSPNINAVVRYPPFQFKPIKVKESKRKLKLKENGYRNDSYPRGLALIISFGVYENNDLPDCTWRNDDVSMFKGLLNKLGYIVKICENADLINTNSCLDEFSKLYEHSNYDSSLILMMGHGVDSNTFYTREGNKLSLHDVYGKFTDNNCPSLKGKPKIFIEHMTILDDSKPKHLEDLNPKHLEDLTPKHLEDLKPKHLQDLKSKHLQDLKPKHLEDLKPNHLEDLKPKHLQELKPKHLEDIKPKHLDDSEPNPLDDLKTKNLEAFKPKHLNNSTEEYPDFRDAFSMQLTSTVKDGKVSSQGLWELRILLEEHAHNKHIIDILSKLEWKLGNSKEVCSRKYFNFNKNFFFNPKEYKD